MRIFKIIFHWKTPYPDDFLRTFLSFSEVALYALDVYYNQTYTNNFKRKQDQSNYYSDRNDNLPLFYQGYPSYYDPYVNTLRSYDRTSNLLDNIGKIPQWLSLAYNM